MLIGSLIILDKRGVWRLKAAEEPFLRLTSRQRRVRLVRVRRKCAGCAPASICLSLPSIEPSALLMHAAGHATPAGVNQEVFTSSDMPTRLDTIDGSA